MGVIYRALRGAGIILALVAGPAVVPDPACAGEAGASTAAGDAAPPLIIKSLHYDFRVDKAGLSVETIHVQIEPTNTATAQQVMQQPIPYSESMGDVDVLEAFTLKSDGHKIPVETSAIYSQPAPGSSQLPMFNDQRQKVIVFPDVDAGDVLDYTYRYRAKQTYLPNSFTAVMAFSRLLPYENVDATVVAPKSLPLVVETHDIAFEKHAEGADIVYHLHYSAPTPIGEDTSILAPFERSPRFLISSVANYEAFARAYAPSIADKEKVTPALQAKADEITAGIADRREQAQKIYEWVSRHIRYVAVEIGKGAIVPHDAATVYANGYGDCKDHVVLFSTLLKAKKIPSALVLINAGNSYTLPDTAIIGAFNHAIAWLPDFDLYADTTSGVAPFGTLPFAEYGKPVLRISDGKGARAQTPVLSPGAATLSIKTIAQMDKDGHVNGRTTTTATGPFSVALRQIARAIQTVGPEHAAANALQAQHMPGSGDFVISSPEEIGPDYTIDSSFAIGPMPDLLTGRRFAMPGPLPVGYLPGDFLMGPLFNTKIKDNDPTPCYSGRETEEISLTAPPGRHFLAAPTDTSIKTDNLSFTAHWTLAGDTLNLRREFTSNIDAPLCAGEIRTKTAEQLTAIRESYLYGGAIAPEVTAQQIQFDNFIHAANAAAKRGDNEEAIRQYSAAIDAGDASHNPAGAAAARVGRAVGYMALRKYDDAIDDFRQAVKADAALAQGLIPLAQSLASVREFERADKVLTLAVETDPTSSQPYYARATVRDNLGNYSDALADFTKAIALAAPGQPLANYYCDRAASYWNAKDLKAALNDYNEALKRDDKLAAAYDGRGRTELMSGAPDPAISDFAKALALDPRNAYHVLWLYIANVRAGKDARSELLRDTEGWDFASWPGPVLKVIRGDMSADQISLPKHPEDWQTERDLCEQDFYLAEFALANGDKSKAIELLRDTVDTDVKEYVEYGAAKYELERLSAHS